MIFRMLLMYTNFGGGEFKILEKIEKKLDLGVVN